MTENSEAEAFTISVYLPPGVSEGQINAVMDYISVGVYGHVLDDRGQWDPFIVGHRGDVLQIDHEGHDCCPPHIYFSTSCFHGDHNYCQSERGLLGNKTPGVCKFCSAPCTCICHAHVVKPGDVKAVPRPEVDQ